MSIVQEELMAKDEQVELIEVSCEIEIEYDEDNHYASKTDADSIHSVGLNRPTTGTQLIETEPSEYDETESERHYIRFDDDDDDDTGTATFHSSESDNSLKTTMKEVDAIEKGMILIFEDKHKETVHTNDVNEKSKNKSEIGLSLPVRLPVQKIDELLYEEELVPLAIKEEVIHIKEEVIDLKEKVIDLNEELWNNIGKSASKDDSISCVRDFAACSTLHLGPNDRYVTIKSIASSDNIEPITVLVRNVDSDKPICETLKLPSNRNPPTKLMVKIHELNKRRPNVSKSASYVVRKSQPVVPVLPTPPNLFPRICLKDTMSLQCVLCNIECSNRKALIEHVKSHSADKKSFECPTCKKTFTQQCNLKRHMRCHSGERPYSCPYCKKLFADQGYLTTHLRYHTNTKPYTCEHCDKSFFDRSNYVKHLKSHSGEKPYPCLTCNKSFLQQSDLTRHMRVHSGERPFQCSFCERSFTQHGDLTTHLRHHTGERPFVCSDCQKTFANKRYLNSHVRGRICSKKNATIGSSTNSKIKDR